MSWQIAAAVAPGLPLGAGVRTELEAAVNASGTNLCAVLEGFFGCIALSWSRWRAEPFARRDRLTLVLIGDCYGEQALTADQLLERYLIQGSGALEGLNGRYMVWVLDEQHQRLELIGDPLGLRKLYVTDLKDCRLFCSHLSALRHVRAFHPRLDPYGAAQLLITSHLCDEHSLLEGVRLIAPAAHLSWGPEGYTQRCYWAPSIDPTRGDLEGGAEALQPLLEHALQRQVGESDELTLPLSGGLDSRLLAGLLPAALRPMTHSFSYGHAHSYDRRIGRRVAKTLGIRHQRLDLPARLYQRYQAQALTLADGEISIEAFPLFRLLEAGVEGSTLVSGYAGDWISSKKRLHPQEGRDRSLQYLWQKLYVRKGFSARDLEAVVVHPQVREGYERLQQTMLEAFDSACADTFADKAQLLEFWHRQRRYVSYQLNVLETRFRVCAPLCDYELVRNWLNMPAHWKEQQRAYRSLIERISPTLAALPVAGSSRLQPLQAGSGGARLDLIGGLRQRVLQSNLSEGARWRLNLLLRGGGRGLVAASGGWLGPHNRGLLVHHDEDIRQDTEWFFKRLMDPQMAEGIYNLDALRRMWEEHLSGRQDHSVRFNNLIVLSAFRRFWSL
ncbi:asparagine synthase-related protein [Aestuariirhabdus litorea]|uniref:asparagine synthase (glutamine-hydrolyzing) n=1 Tax=Aestuariirhabdus litorea TaxID=2528527 RepID=A0A3P3VPA8_9GAMM|nr:asparagine synthase-related protein [Aestuariirhabdus litorea]RRJ84440.1 hypothetical protein D0544_04870 [Aestuariirhabdus litorea]RWW97664.1 hypothetical protein DZC74_04860 [Endozoicomonadaceae bacterium GTF-13]